MGVYRDPDALPSCRGRQLCLGPFAVPSASFEAADAAANLRFSEPQSVIHPG